jgi:hypothetical protein
MIAVVMAHDVFEAERGTTNLQLRFDAWSLELHGGVA